MDREAAIAGLKAHEAELKRLGVRNLYLFGSTARGEARDDWDVDLFFDYEKGKSSRHLAAELKARHPDIPWRKVAGIGNVLRHSHESVATPLMWSLVHDDLPSLERGCREELAALGGSA
jgi:predicted nucleotidyltransferase